MVVDLDQYMARVGLHETPEINEEGLGLLHRAQFFAIPFENLDIHLGRPIALDRTSLQRKLVDRKRGGYCFELNGLMLAVLESLGFQARPLLARVHLAMPPSGRTHQVNAVTLGGRTWLLDVGFGAGGPRAPMLLEDGWEVRDKWWGARLLRCEPWGWMMESFEDSTWRASYSFDLAWVTEQDIEVSNHYTSTSPKTHFTQQRVVSRPTERGRVSLRNRRLTRIEAGGESTEDIPDGDEYLARLRLEFGIELDARFEDFKSLQVDCSAVE